MANDSVNIIDLDQPGRIIDLDKDVERPSNPGKQAVAGFVGMPTDTLGAMGLANAAIQAPVDYAFDAIFKPEASVGDSFKARLRDSTFLDISSTARNAINNALGIKEPTSAEDQVARMAASALFPIPGSLAATTAGKMLMVATPGVVMGPNFARNAGIQLGVNFGAEQGIRALSDDEQFPTIFEKGAYEGVPIAPRPETKLPPKYIDLDQQMKEEEEFDAIDLAVGAASLYALYRGAKYIGKHNYQAMKEGNQLGPTDEFFAKTYEGVKETVDEFKETRQLGGTVGEAFEAAKDTGADHFPGLWKNTAKNSVDYLNSGYFDAKASLAAQAKSQNVPDNIIDTMVASSHTDPRSQAKQVWDDGILPGTEVPNINAGRQLRNDYLKLNQGQQQLFDSIPAVVRDLLTPVGTTGGLTQLQAAAAARRFAMIRQDPQVAALMDKVRENYQGYLRYMEDSGLVSREQADLLQDKFRIGGETWYFPLMNDTTEGAFETLRRWVGVESKVAKEIEFASTLHARSEVPSRKRPLMTTLDSLEAYNNIILDHILTSKYQYGAAEALGGIRHLGNGQFRNLRLHGNRIGAPPATDKTATRIIATKALDDDITVEPKWRMDDPLIADGGIKAINRDKIHWVHHKDEMVGVYAPNPHVYQALQLNPILGPVDQFFNHWNNFFKSFVTGHRSLFAPISSTFSAQQVAMNTVADVAKEVRQSGGGIGQQIGKGAVAGAKSGAESITGVMKLMRDSMAKSLSDYLTASINTRSNLYRQMPQQLERFRNKMEGVYNRSVMNHITRETGRVNTSVSANNFTDPRSAMMRFSANFNGKFGRDEMLLLHRLWMNWNTAFHEGPAFAVMLKKIGDADFTNMTARQQQKLMRDAAEQAKNLAGDMRRVGGTAFARSFNAAVPFSGAMIQSWATIGRALKANWPAFSAGLAALIGIPTAAELIYNSLAMDDNEIFIDERGRGWTYRDYYWNGFSSKQRADNFIYFVPGQPPWEAVTIPVSPEWSLFRSVVIEGMDAAFGLSNTGFAGLTGVNGNHIQESLGRVLDVPLPPLVAATLSSIGADVRLGVHPVVPDDPNASDTSIGLLNVPTGKGERLTPGLGRTQYANQALDKDTVAVLQDLFGSAGALYVQVYEAVHTGATEEHGSLARAGELGLEALGDGLSKQARYLNPLWSGGILRSSTNSEINRELLAKRRGLDRLEKASQVYLSQGRLGVDGTPLPGSSVIPSDDPRVHYLSQSASALLSEQKMWDEQVAKARKQLDSVGNTGRIEGREITITERNKFVDAMKHQINNYKAIQLMSIQKAEQELSAFMSSPQGFGEEIEVSFGTLAPRPNLGPGSVFQERR